MKTRFCPSPTGLMHLGNVRTALFNALLAKRHHGIFLLRIEDTDKARSDERYTLALQTDLKWLSMHWQEGPEHDQGNGPYFQSQRQALYDRYYQQLEQQKLAYPCFCSEAELAISRKIQLSQNKPPRYAGTCRSLTAEQIAQKQAGGLKATLRFYVADDQIIEFDDLVKGKQRFLGRDIGDFIIRRTDGTPPFMYCNAIDDALMGVTHALRGEDHLTNTPRQLMILQALGLPIPHYGHLSLILGEDGAPLSKRNGSRSIQELREQGFLPIAIHNYLARLGHHYSIETFLSFEQLAEHFSTKSLGSAPAHFNYEQLLYWQKIAVMQLSQDALWQWFGAEIQAKISNDNRNLFLKTIQPNIMFPKDVLHWVNIFYSNELRYTTDHQAILIAAGKQFFTTALQAVQQYGADFAKVSQTIQQEQRVKGKLLFQPLRVAVTAELHGPQLDSIFLLLGAERLKQRLEQAASSAK